MTPMDIRNIRLRDGTPCASVPDAVQKFKCPGPCSPDCPLYPSVRIHGDTFGHMCHDTVIARYPMAVLDAMQCSYEIADGDAVSEEARYAAVIRSRAVRDVQFCKSPDCDITDDGSWDDLPDAEIWLGFFQGPDALDQASRFGMTDPANIRLIPVGQEPEKEPRKEN